MDGPTARGTVLPFAGATSQIELQGRAGYTLQLQPNAPQQYDWSPGTELLGFGRMAPLASDLDLQVQWISAQPPATNPPLVYWRVEYGHGDAVYRVPMAATLGGALATRTQGWLLPQRGLRLRLPARQLKVVFFVPLSALPPGPSTAACEIQVSVQPCAGMHAPQVPRTDMQFLSVAPGVPSQLPMGATEMRASVPTTGQPFAAAEQIEFTDVTGANPIAVNLSAFADWRPIPIFAAFWRSDANAQVSYR